MIKFRSIEYYKALKRLYSKANKYAERTGRRLLPLEDIKERFEICKTCEHFNGYRCSLCNCCSNDKTTHFNKLAFPTERCPGDPPRFKEIT